MRQCLLLNVIYIIEVNVHNVESKNQGNVGRRRGKRIWFHYLCSKDSFESKRWNESVLIILYIYIYFFSVPVYTELIM